MGGKETNRKAISLFICQVPGYQCKYKHEHVAISLNEDIGNLGVKVCLHVTDFSPFNAAPFNY